MSAPRLYILNTADASWWDTRKRLPKFLEPREFSLNPCNSCPGHCCQPVGAMTITEAVRIATMLHMNPDLFVEVRAADSQRMVRRGEAYPIPLDQGDVQLFVRLNEAHWCPFLHRVGERGYCSIYNARPGICRVYPFELLWKKRHFRVGSTTYCPVPWLQNDETRAAMEANMELWDHDVALHRKVVRSWIKAAGEDRSWGAFFVHAVKALARPLKYDAAAVLERPRRRLGAPE